MNEELFYNKVEGKLRSDNCKKSTINLYLSGIKRFVKFCQKTDINQIDSNDLGRFSNFLFKEKKLKYGTLRPIKYGINYGFNVVLKNNLDIDLIPIPKQIRAERQFFSRTEISGFFSAINNVKYRTIFQLIYSIGLDVNEVITIKITDINSEKKVIHINEESDLKKRTTHLPASILKILRSYYAIYHPKIYLFEGQKEGSQISDRTIQHAFRQSIENLNINKPLTSRSLKYSYVKHLTEDGIPLNSVLNQLRITNTETFKLYNDICFPLKKFNSSPFDSLSIEQNDEVIFFDTRDLEYILLKIKDKEERDYFSEGIRCFKANALRAGVIFLWTASVFRIQKMCLTQSLGFINTELKKIYPKAKDVKVIDDFAFIKDEYLLELACKLKLIDKSKKEELKNTCLDLRNKCGHPGKYKPKSQKIKAFVEDIIGMLY